MVYKTFSAVSIFREISEAKNADYLIFWGKSVNNPLKNLSKWYLLVLQSNYHPFTDNFWPQELYRIEINAILCPYGLV
jgi:hypothetical protein